MSRRETSAILALLVGLLLARVPAVREFLAALLVSLLALAPATWAACR